MPKSKRRVKSPLKSKPSNHSGVALVVCFLIATISVSIALRQLVLERRLLKQVQETNSLASRLPGQYTANVPGVPNPSRVTLDLASTRTATLTRKTVDQAPLVQQGSWSGDSNGTVIVTLGDKTYAFSYLPSGIGSLRLLNPDLQVWGAATVTLTRQ